MLAKGNNKRKRKKQVEVFTYLQYRMCISIMAPCKLNILLKMLQHVAL